MAPFTIIRTLAAPRELVWKAFTELEHLKNWWGPKGFTWATAKLDLRPGGVFHYCVESPGGDKMWGRFVYGEITPQRRIVFVSSFSDELGDIVRNPFAAKWPLEVQNTLTLEENGGETALTLTGAPIHASEEEASFFGNMHPSLEKGFAGAFGQLAEYLAS